MSLRLSGQNQLSYIGVTPLQPPDLVYIERDPISGAVQNADYRQFNVGTFWLNPVNDTLWILVRKGGTPPAPLWLSLGISPVALITHFTTDDLNIVNPIALNVNIFGGSNINTTGASPTVTINLNPNIIVTSVITDTLTVNNDATFNGNILTNLSRGVVQSPGGGGALFSDEGTDGQILISSSAGAPAWANIISSDASITVTNGANSIDITTAGGSGTLNTLTGNSGVATAAAGNINVVTANSTPVFVGAADTLTLDFLDAVDGNLVLGSDLPALTTGQFNTGIGAFSLVGITSGISNTALGNLALTTVSSGDDNTAIGDSAGTNIALGSNNILIGVNAGINYTNENDNIVLGNTGTVADSGAIRIGTFGTHTSAFVQGITSVIPGSNFVTVDASGQLGIASGGGPLSTLTGNVGAPAVPDGAGNINIKTDNATVLFDSAVVANQVTQDFGLSNLLLGSSGSLIALAGNNVGYGLNALNLLTNGTDNSAVGAFSLSILTNGSRNTAVGFDTLQALTTQNDNTAVGYSSLNLSTGSNNTAFGSSSLNMLSTGMNNIAVGRLAGSALVAGESDNIYIGNTGVAADSGVTRIGTDLIQTTAFMAGVSGVTPTGPNQMVIMNSSGQLGTQSIPPGGGTPSGFQVFTSNDTFTTPATTTADTVFEFTVVGGGGGGGGVGAGGTIGAGGGAAGTSIYLVTGLAPLLACPIVIGSGGAGGIGGVAGSSGTDSTATVNAVVVTGSGGGGGAGSTSAGVTLGGTGGAASNGTINISGQYGFDSGTSRSGQGGNTSYGSGGKQVGNGNGNNGNGYGSGASGGRGGDGLPRNGGNGAPGIVIVKYW